MKKLLLLSGFLILLSCHKEQISIPVAPVTCLVTHPLTELSWLQDSIARYTSFGGEVTVRQALYQQQTVFSIDSDLGPDADVETFYQCDGTVICKSAITIAGQVGNCGNIPSQLTNQVTIYEKRK